MLGVLVGLICAMTWATSAVTLRDLSKKLDPFTLNAPRTLVGGLSIVLLTFATGRSAGYQAVTPDKLFFMLASVLVGGGAGDVFCLLSLARIGVSRAFPIASIYPAFTLLLGLALLTERVTVAIVAGLALVILGIILVGRKPSAEESHVSGPAAWSGVGLALIAAVCWVGSMVLIGEGVEGLDSIMVSSIRAPALSLALWGVVAVRRSWSLLADLTRKEWAILIGGGIVGWGLGSALFVMSVAMVGATRAAILTSTSPLFALPLSRIFLKEKTSRGVLLGTALTVAGVILVS